MNEGINMDYQDQPTPIEKTEPERILFPSAALAGFLSAELGTLDGVHPEVIYQAIERGRSILGLTMYINGPGEQVGPG